MLLFRSKQHKVQLKAKATVRSKHKINAPLPELKCFILDFVENSRFTYTIQIIPVAMAISSPESSASMSSSPDMQNPRANENAAFLICPGANVLMFHWLNSAFANFA